MAKKQTVEAVEAKNSIPAAEKKPLNKFGKKETHTVEEIEYTFQFPGTRRAQQIVDGARGIGGVFNDESYHDALMQEVIVSPKTDWNYWDEHNGYREVMALADNFLGRMLN